MNAYALRIADTGGNPHVRKGAYVRIYRNDPENSGFGFQSEFGWTAVDDISEASFYRSQRHARKDRSRVTRHGDHTEWLEIVEFELREVRVVKSSKKDFKYKKKPKAHRSLHARVMSLGRLSRHVIVDEDDIPF